MKHQEGAVGQERVMTSGRVAERTESSAAAKRSSSSMQEVTAEWGKMQEAGALSEGTSCLP